MKFLKKKGKNLNKDKITDSSAAIGGGGGAAAVAGQEAAAGQGGSKSEKVSMLKNGAADGEATTDGGKETNVNGGDFSTPPTTAAAAAAIAPKTPEIDLINKKLPKELLIRIFSYLDVVTLCRCAQVSKVTCRFEYVVYVRPLVNIC
jgi:hypothetical protein